MQRIAAPVYALALFAGAVLYAPLAEAHAHLKTQYPAANATITDAPQALTLTFTEAIEPAFIGLTLTRKDNQHVPIGPIKTDPPNATQIIVPFKQPLIAGEHLVACMWFRWMDIKPRAATPSA